MALSCFFAAGVSLGLFFGPMLLIGFLAPPLAMSEETVARRLLVCAGLCSGVVLIWGVTANLAIFDFVRCSALLAAYVLALAGSAALLDRVGMGKVFAAALVALIAFAWLAWPVWLVPWLTGQSAQAIVQGLTVAHPLMALNGVLFDRFNIWDRYTLSYQHLTTLNQDIFYSLPQSIAAMVASHAGVGIAGIGGISFVRFLRQRKPETRPGGFHVR